MQGRGTLGAIALVAALLAGIGGGSAAEAGVFDVDYGSSTGNGGGPGGLQPGFVAFEDTETTYNPALVKSYASVLGAAGTLDVEVAGYTHFRDYAAITGGPYVGQSALLSDMILRNTNGTMGLTLQHLRPGIYQLTTYHHSTQFGGGSVDIRLFDAAGLNQTVADNVPVSGGQSPASISTQAILIEAGGAPVRVDFLGGSGGNHNSLNGFELAPVLLQDIARKTPALAVDINDRGAPGPSRTQAGFSEFLLTDGTGGTATYGPYTVTLSHASGGALDDRRRGQPTNTGAFTEQELLRDFVFARTDSTDDGIEVLIQGLEPETSYEVALWSFDDGSGGRRTSDWYVNGVLAMDDYYFNGDSVPASQPASNDIYSFRFLAFSDAAGQLLLQGLAVSPLNLSRPAVFLNAFEVVKVELIPEPGTLALLGLGGLGALVRRRWRRAGRGGDRSVSK